MGIEIRQIKADFVVIGAGIAGICAAVQAARNGVRTVIINDRGYVGGNNSAEIFVGLGGASDGNKLNINLREGGIVEEIRLEYNYRSPHKNRFALDATLMDLIYAEKNISLFLNTYIDEVIKNNEGEIVCVKGSQNTTETRWEFFAKWFCDDTGDGTIGALSGAEYMLGREAASTFGEKVAPEQADKFCIPSTLNFIAHDEGFPVKYIPPTYADDIEASCALQYREIPHNNFNRMQWYYEVSGELDQIKDREEIIKGHRSLVSGIWNYIKNSGKYPEAENYDFEYISCIPGMRESRRLTGDYILTESQLVNQEEYVDAVAHGGWNIDLHAIKGFYDTDLVNRHIHFRGPYQIPLRCGYSKNVNNLFMCGRCMSTSHVAFGSTRLSATLSTLGQAVGMAAGLCKKYSINPRKVYQDHIKELQQKLLQADQLILGVKNEDEADLAKRARIKTSSEMEFAQLPSEKSFYKQMNMDLGITLPVKKNIAYTEIFLCAEKETVLDYAVYKPFKKYNYGPDILLGRYSINLQEGKQCIKLPLERIDEDGYYFIELAKNSTIEILVSSAELPTVMLFENVANEHTSMYDYATMQMRKTMWERTDIFPCIKLQPEQNIYEASNIINGYNRAIGMPNLWMSVQDDSKPEVLFTWEKPVAISNVQLTFAIDTTVSIEHYSIPIFPGLAEDYEIYAINDEKEQLIAKVCDNHQKVSRIEFTPTTCSALKIVFTKMSEKTVGLYEVRIWNK